MNTEVLELLWRCLSLLLALVVLPGVYIWLLARPRSEGTQTPPRFELFVGFGTVGGWFLNFALAGSGPLIILPLAAFQTLVALPVSVFCPFRLARRAAPSRYRTTAFAMLFAGVLMLVGILALSCLQGERAPSVRTESPTTSLHPTPR